MSAYCILGSGEAERWGSPCLSPPEEFTGRGELGVEEITIVEMKVKLRGEGGISHEPLQRGGFLSAGMKEKVFQEEGAT